jgi:hypothetical protein
MNFGWRKPDFDSVVVHSATDKPGRGKKGKAEETSGFSRSISPEYQYQTLILSNAQIVGAFWRIGLTAGAGFDGKPGDKLPPTFNVIKSRRTRVGIF